MATPSPTGLRTSLPAFPDAGQTHRRPAARGPRGHGRPVNVTSFVQDDGVLRRRKISLRNRATIAFAVTSLVVVTGTALLTYGVARRYLVNERESAARQQAYVNARLVRTVLRSQQADLTTFLTGLGGGNASASVVRYQGDWYSTSVAVGAAALPSELVSAVEDGAAGSQRVRDSSGTLNLVVGVRLAAVEASYFEIFPLTELDRTLGLLAQALVVGASLSAVTAAVVGRVLANQLVRPLGPVADAAERIAGGALDTRLDESLEPDLERLSHAFNTMAAALEERIEREARFAADVSHELRTPLTAVAAAVEIMDRRRDQLPPQVLDAFNVLARKVGDFQHMVLDLLEISRMDAGTAAVLAEPVDLRVFVRLVASRNGIDPASVTVDPDVTETLWTDRRRLGQAISNVIDNASKYAGGTTAIRVCNAPRAGYVRFCLDDQGPGVDPDERQAIFGRFARGDAGRAAGGATGTGLGLALVAEHLRVQRGRVWVEENPSGAGARFVIEVLNAEP
jgi:two-component system, OmpR family, sensor histidine kinase MtrB